MTHSFKLNYNVYGWDNGNKAPLIWLTHGAAGDLKHFVKVVLPLIDDGFRVLTHDVRFHGLSQSEGDADITATFEFSQVIKDMDSILQRVQQDHYKGESIDLFIGGLSMGGVISILYAGDQGHVDQWKANKITLKGIILLASGVPYLEASRPGWDLFRTRQATQEVLSFMKVAIIESSETAEGRKETKRAMNLISNHALYECFVAIALLYPEPSTPLKQHEPLTQVPMLLVSPEKDPYTREEMEILHAANLQHGIPSEYVKVAEAGHMVILDKSEEVSNLISDFCSRYK